ncbi:family 43 glycosylhydrolase [Paenarthrobacter sp. YAF11_1]|uniref:glycoside hydrolase family 43 protein n=1 Tax=Paenarthrobacter sp. YAF11_1 TaxID=3233074 RepID=UPI003F9695C4
MNTITNPVIRGHAPDPSVVRVGDDFYLANSSFGFLPGIPISHSTDLVNWRTIGFAVSRPEQYRRDGEPGPISLFAPTLRHEEGLFYLVCTNQAEGQGNFFVTATDPSGPWSKAVWLDEESFDPSLFRDSDGSWYYTRRTLQFRPDGNLGPIVQARIDISTGALGEFHALTENNRGFSSNDIEGPHLFSRGGWYYLTAAEGSSWKGHMQTIARSKSPWGPFEPAPHNPILTHRDRVAHSIQSVGHADFVEDATGNWWAVSLGTRHEPFASHHTLGRETFLTPVTWTEDGWPVVGQGGHTESTFEDLPLPSGTGTRIDTPDSLWLRGWRTLQAPDTAIDASQSDDHIEVLAGLDLTHRPPVGALFRAQTEFDQSFTATVTQDTRVDAGIAVYANSVHFFSALVRAAETERYVSFRRVVDDIITEDQIVIPAEGNIRLSVTATGGTYTFTAKVGEASWELGSGNARLISAEAAQWFVNVNFALVAVDHGSEGGSARFSHVRVEKPLDIKPPTFAVPY